MTAQAPFVMITAPAKINLYLGVHPERDERGYHKVDSVMTCIDLADTVAIAPGSELMVKMVPAGNLPQESNTAWKAARAMGEAFGRPANFTIVIDKHIPAGSGLGGASADAAAVIRGTAASASTGGLIRWTSASTPWRVPWVPTCRSSCTVPPPTSTVPATRCASSSARSPVRPLRS